MIAEIQQWLNGDRNYENGAKLYLKHGKDKLLHKVFAEPASDFKKKRLHEALLGLYRGDKKIEVEIEDSKEIVLERTISAEKRWPEERDEVLAALHAKWKPLFAEMMHLCTTILDVARAGEKDESKKKEAGKMAHRILDLDDRCDAIYDQRDHYIKHGQLPAEEKQMDDVVVDPKKIPIALQNAERYVREYKIRVKNNPTNEKFAAQLKKWEGRIAIYKKELNIE